RSSRRIPIFQLHRIDPWLEVGISSMRKPARDSLRRVAKCSRPLPFASHKQFRFVVQPGMVQSQVIRHKIENQSYAMAVETVVKLLHGHSPSERFADPIDSNCV